MTKKISKVLIANRGEIAVRIIRSCQKLGIKTVAVYSEADESAMHVLMADEAVLLGPPPSAESYLLMDKIIQACKDTGADAVHPGFGFLAENGVFVDKLEEEGITFIGPKKYAVEVMGDKIGSKEIAGNAGVPLIPGHNKDIADSAEAIEVAKGIGYPVMVKASAGGGGKGMRIVRSEEEMAMSFDFAKSEAINSFGDGRIFMEKFVDQPRHIEIQVLFDKHGNGVYLNERECSIQRRNQKIIEEAPSVPLDAKLRAEMGTAAVNLGKVVEYVGAGTVEFMVDKDNKFYFLEMNTRLQVEHPVTEMITGIDLVEQQIKVAEGEKLSITQDDVKIDGWALEVRIYSEDPRNSFLPSIGTLTHYAEPKGDEVRVDSGITGGNEVSLYYDPMIAKLIVHAKTRDAALDKMSHALNDYEISGVVTNIDFLQHIIKHPKFRSGEITTKFIEDYYPEGFEAVEHSPEQADKCMALAAFQDLMMNHYALDEDGEKTVYVKQEDDTLEAAVCKRSGDKYDIAFKKETYHFRYSGLRFQNWKKVLINGDEETVQFEWDGAQYVVTLYGLKIKTEVYATKEQGFVQYMPERFDPSTADEIYAPMPGKVLKMIAKEGDSMKKGQPVAVLEAMKMENAIILHKDAKIVKIIPEEGTNVESGSLMFVLEEE